MAEIADRIAVMRQGRLVEIGPASQILRSPAHPYTRALIAAVPSFTPAPRPKAPAREAPNACLKLVGLSKSYGATAALKATDLEVNRGATLAIVGESGSGKSTLAKLLVRLVAPSGGLCLVNGDDLARLSGRPLRNARRSIQMIFQDPLGSLNPREAWDR